MFKNGSASQNGNDDEHKEKDKEKEAAKVRQSPVQPANTRAQANRAH
jgi:hypothetical protein